MTGMVVVGHGSHRVAETAGLVWRFVDRLRSWGAADEVGAAFWKEPPSFHQVLDSFADDDIVVVPAFTADGYFTKTVIPAEMGLVGRETIRDRRRIRYAATLAEHPVLNRLVDERIDSALVALVAPVALAAPAGNVAVVLIGHGTRRDADSRRATLDQVERVRQRQVAAEVVAVFLDDEPGVERAFELTSAPILVAVPFFLAAGSHATEDLPPLLGLPAGSRHGASQGRHVYMTAPVGNDDSVASALWELAAAAGFPLAPRRVGKAWDCFPSVGRDLLWSVVQEVGHLPFGALSLTCDVVRPLRGADDASTEVSTPEELRRWVRTNPFRPLPTARDLPTGWRIAIDGAARLHAVVETVYPGLVADWASRRAGTFRTSALAELAERQTGQYRRLAELPADAVARTVARVCGHCIRSPSWVCDSGAVLPCAEPCNVWMSEALTDARHEAR